jgi:hypothetical protein
MFYLKYILGSILLCCTLNLFAQNDSIDYLVPFYIEDAVGNKDTVYAGGSRYAVAGYNPQLGEVNLVDVPFDSILEARLVRAIDIIDYINEPPVCSKKMITRFNDFGTFGDCSIAMEAFVIVLNCKYPPFTVSWEQDVFEEGAVLYCSQGTYIVNSMVSFLLSNGIWAGEEGFDASCLAHDVANATFQLWGGTFPGGPFGGDFALYPVEGSMNEVDSLQILLGYFNANGTEPCATYINSTDSPEVESDQLKLYPNPTSNRVYLELGPTLELKELEVISLTGQTLYRARFYDQSGIDVSELPPGVYVLRYQTVRGKMGSHRFIKQ